MRLKIDENLPIEVAEAFEVGGHDAISVSDQGLAGAGDPAVAAACSRENRCLVTLDTDFADIRAYPPGTHSGIIVIRLKRADRQSILAVTSRLLVALESQAPDGALWIVDEQRIRVREST